MTKDEWIETIKNACIDADTYESRLDSVIDTLAQILEDRDSAREQYIADGSRPTVIHINRAGEANVCKNPMLTIQMELNTQALAYWRDLGLTVKAYKSLGKADSTKKAVVGLEALLAGLTDGEKT